MPPPRATAPELRNGRSSCSRGSSSFGANMVVAALDGEEDDRSAGLASVVEAGAGLLLEGLRAAGPVLSSVERTAGPAVASSGAAQSVGELMEHWRATWDERREDDEQRAADDELRRAFQRTVDTVLDQLDLTALVIEHLDIQRVASTLDMNALIADLDMDQLTDRIDMGRLTDRIDIDALVARLDVEALLARLDVPTIAAQVIDELDLPEMIRAVSADTTSEGVRDVAVARRRGGPGDPPRGRPAAVACGRCEAMSAHHVSFDTVPEEARSFHGQPAGLVTRTVANVVDLIVVAALLAAGYLAVAGVLFLRRGAGFSFPIVGFRVGYAVVVRRLDRLHGRRVGVERAAPTATSCSGCGSARSTRARCAGSGRVLRAVLCAIAPLLLIWVAFSRQQRSVQDLIVGTHVVYDWGGSRAGHWVRRRGRGACRRCNDRRGRTRRRSRRAAPPRRRPAMTAR